MLIDEVKGRMYFDTSGDYSEAFAEFYETYMEAMDEDEGTGDCSAMAITEKYSKGMSNFKARTYAGTETQSYLGASSSDSYLALAMFLLKYPGVRIQNTETAVQAFSS